MGKIAKPNTKKIEKPTQLPLPRGRSEIDVQHVTKAVIHRWIAALKEFETTHPHAKNLRPFLKDCGYSRTTYSRALVDYPELKEAHEAAMEEIGWKLWGNSVDFKANWTPLKFMIHKYGKDFLEAKELEANLKSQENQQGITLVAMPEIPKPKEDK